MQIFKKIAKNPQMLILKAFNFINQIMKKEEIQAIPPIFINIKKKQIQIKNNK